MINSFQKKKSLLITFRSSETGILFDYILVNNKYINSVQKMKVIRSEEIVSQHFLLMNMVFKRKVRRKVKFREKLKL